LNGAALTLTVTACNNQTVITNMGIIFFIALLLEKN
jgi:hypothetical protein